MWHNPLSKEIGHCSCHFGALGRLVDTNHQVRNASNQQTCNQHHSAHKFLLEAEDPIKMGDKEDFGNGQAGAQDEHDISSGPGQSEHQLGQGERDGPSCKV